MRVIIWLTLLIAVAALVLGILAHWGLRQLENRVEENEANIYAGVDEAMESVVHSFEINHLDFDLQWRTKDGFTAEVGVFR